MKTSLLLLCLWICAQLPTQEPSPGETHKVEVMIDDIAPFLKDLGIPELKGRARFHCSCSAGRVSGDHGWTINGFSMNLTLEGTLKENDPGIDKVLSSDLKTVHLTYTDDLVEARGVTERDLPGLIEKLHQEQHRVRCNGAMIPGGEVMSFSAPMKQLILLGDKARPALEAALKDEAIQNEVVLILGAIGNEKTVPLLIELYPDSKSPSGDPIDFKLVCLAFALPYLTGQEIGRSRQGAETDQNYRPIWKEWWQKNGKDFKVSKTKPNATWVPMYPAFEWAVDFRKQFIRELEKKSKP